MSSALRVRRCQRGNPFGNKRYARRSKCVESGSIAGPFPMADRDPDSANGCYINLFSTLPHSDYHVFSAHQILRTTRHSVEFVTRSTLAITRPLLLYLPYYIFLMPLLHCPRFLSQHQRGRGISEASVCHILLTGYPESPGWFYGKAAAKK